MTDTKLIEDPSGLYELVKGDQDGLLVYVTYTDRGSIETTLSFCSSVSILACPSTATSISYPSVQTALSRPTIETTVEYL